MTGTIHVNDVTISEAAVLAEMQHHPAPDQQQAAHAAATALVIRQVLCQQAAALGIAGADEEAQIAALLDAEISLPAPDRESCRRYYDNNPQRFRSPDLFEASHILIAADPEDAAARAAAKAEAMGLIETLHDHPERFAELARDHSACPSRDVGGSLGQVSRHQTLPEIDSFLYQMSPGQISPAPVPTRYGYHVLYLHHRIDGAALPFNAVADKIADYLKDRSWAQAVHQYIAVRLGEARITGIEINGADSPLVQ